MFFVHQVHALRASSAEAFEATLRQRWAPALVREPGMRLAWCARSMPGVISFPEIVTLTAISDGDALERYGARLREGDLADEASSLAAARVRVATRVMAPLAFNPLEVAIDDLPLASDDGPGEMYLHDFVPPRVGMQRAYEDAMQKVYMAIPDDALLQIVIWAGLETVAGGGPNPESLNISHVRDASALTQLLAFEAPRDNKQIGSWMYDALKLRDTLDHEARPQPAVVSPELGIGPGMTARFVGASVHRVEDGRVLTGTARFLDDVSMPGLLHAAFVRSSTPHARLRAVDVGAAREAEGVVAVFTAADLARYAGLIDYPVAPTFLGPSAYPALADGKVRHVGDPIALVVATSCVMADDAAELVVVDYEPLPPIGTSAEALAGDLPPIWDDAGTNILWTDQRDFGDPDGAFRRADRVVSTRLRQHRVANAPMETRGIIAAYDRGRRELTCHAATQNPQLVRLTLARLLQLPAHSVRVINDDIGGSFGQKAWVRHEDVAVAAAAVATGRPVKWVESRSENITTAGHARDEYADIEVAVNDDGEIVGLRVALVMDQGAYPIASNVRTGTVAIMRTLLPSAYRIEHYSFSATIVASNKASYTTYRGPWAAETWLRERTLDFVAHELGMDPVAFRRRNLWDAQDLPRPMVTGPTLSALTVKSSLVLLEQHPTYRDFRARQAAARAEGRYIGIGVAAFEPAPGPADFHPSASGFIPPSEPARITVELDGSITVAVIQTPGGQGHETTVAQVAADELGVPMERVRIVHGDTSVVPLEFFGTAGSRSAQKTTGAVRGASRDLAEKMRRIAAHLLEASEHDIDLDEGRAFVRGSPGAAVPFAQLAMVAWNLPTTLPPGVDKGLEALCDYTNEDSGWSQAVHCCTVEIDPETGEVTVTDYIVFEDCGELINPSIVEGQIRGGVAQGVSSVLYERIEYDDDANLLTSTFLDYLVPSAVELPDIEVHHVESTHASAVNVRGVGEGGAIVSPAAASNAIEDALTPFGARVTELHMAPAAVLALLKHEATEMRSA